ncbi:MAG: selenium-dependent xanthine dehydrogenase [Oscillibacter ruminantium]|uniref:selenium-dependent xanthine dehydrogenase n=1 Tax=Oscillibacter ruminantium TaxID=1263547 RepID=UPI00058BE637|nr:selenium-dependent xanthine dehydrogenase [Oscillibacter ruminantium]MEA5042051.1 selenium-dependent xanthine dehydrogenase [Oscillibacter ruminantium]
MATFTVNGKAVSVEKNQKLIRFLRDELHLTSVKDGCSEGACGTCTVLIDGKPTKACIPQTDKMEGKSVLTVEGLSDFEKDVYTYAFGKAGAVQCGFCIPGMVISAKALLDANPNPTREEAAFAIRNNICRCTGYVKIIDGILLAAETLRSGEIPALPTDWNLGARVPRVDVREKVTGTGQYPDDVYLDGMLYASAVRSRYPRARVLAIRTEAAKALPGVAGVFTAADIPGQNKVGHLQKDWDTMIPVGEVTHYLGDTICIVAAETKEILEQAKALVEVDYEELPMVRSPKEAMLPDAPLVHRSGNLLAHKHIQRGNPAEAIARSKYVLTQHFSTPWTEHAFLEPECAVAFPEGDGVTIWSTDQGAYDTQHETMGMLGLPAEKVKVKNLLVGGGFGGKEDVTVQHHAALVAYLLKRPVKVKLTRAESILIHPKRHPMEMEFSMGCDENGIIQGVAAEVIADTGAYASLGGPVLERACTHAAGPYNYQNFEIDGWAYYTNNPPAGAFRGFGVTQTCFCVESLLNQMADKVGITPWEIRWRNAIRPGQELPNGQIVDASTGLAETLEAVKPYYDAAKYVGIGCAMKNAGVGVGIPDTGRIRLRVEEGKLHIYAGASCIGQGLGTVLTQMVCDQTGLGRDDVVYERSNTYLAPDSGTTSGSRQTLVTGEACRRACEKLNEAKKENPLSHLEGQEFYGEYLAKTDPLGADVPNPVSHVAYGYATQICILDDEGKIEKIVAAHDVGKAVNPTSVEGQIEGGVVMSMGFALTERYPLEDCKPLARYGTLGLFRANQVPEVKALIVEKPGLDVACGAIGIGEITSIPTAPAIADAYFRYDGNFRSSLPLENTPYSKK